MRWGYEERSGGLSPLQIELSQKDYCHALITGASGSGKSYALLYLLGNVLQEEQETTIYFCDFKNSEDFEFLYGYKNYYAGDSCYEGIMEYYRCFCEKRRTRKHDKRYLLIVDEYPAMINYLTGRDKQEKTKKAGDVLNAVAEILMLGRSMEFGIWIVTQRPDSTLFANGARDNFMIIVGLGRMSKEQKSMIFTGEDIPNKIFQRGEGMLLADGYAIREVKYPRISNVISWKQHITEILTRNESISGS